jgi:hypothetical protein
VLKVLPCQCEAIAIAFLFRDIYTTPSAIREIGPTGGRIAPVKKLVGMTLAPRSRIPYNPIALNRGIILHVISVTDLDKFAEEAGSR